MSTFVSAFLLGLVFNAAPGAVLAETLRQAARGGFPSALGVQVGSLVGDATWAVLGLCGVGLLLQVQGLAVPLGAAACAYMLWLAFCAWTAPVTPYEGGTAQDVAPRGALFHGAAISLTNPQNLAFWASVGSAIHATGIARPTASDYTLFLGGFMLASCVWALACAGAVATLVRRLPARALKVANRLCALAFVAFALHTLLALMGWG